MQAKRMFLPAMAAAMLLGSGALGGCAFGVGGDGDGAASDRTGEAGDPAYAKFEEPVVLRIGFKIPDARLTTGDTNDNNPMSRYLERMTNVKVVHSWEAKGDDAFWQQAELAVASSDLPDALVVNRELLDRLVSRGLVEDLGATFERYGSRLVKDLYDSTGGKALAEATFGGKLYGLPNVAIEADAMSLLWVRQDWLDRLGLAAPATPDDIGRVARAFVERDPDGNGKRDTVGLAGFKGVVYGQKPNVGGFDSVFGAYRAFPKNWIRGADGRLVYGSIAPENKEALAKLAEWYKLGLIDPRFALYKEPQEPIVTNRAGLFFGPWWMPYWPLSEAVATDTKAEWRAYAAPVDAAGKFATHLAPVTDRYLVVRRGYEHPEAVVKLLNFFTRLERRQDPNAEEVKLIDEFAARTGIQPRAYYPFDLLIDDADAIMRRYEGVQSALRGKLTPDRLDPDTRKVYESTIEEEANPKKDLDGWKEAQAYKYGVGALIEAPMVKVRSEFYGTTETMKAKWAELEKLENETFLNIIVGDLPVGAFDGFVEEWMRLGGERITREVELAIAADPMP